MAKKATDIELQTRIATVQEMIIKGLSKSKICRYVSENWNLSERQGERYIADAFEEIKATANKDKEKNVALAISRYNDLFEKNYKIQDYRECRQVQDSLNKLLGINEPDKVEIKSNTIKVEIKD